MTTNPGSDLETTYHIRAFNSLEDALAERPDALFITNPNHLHLSLAMAAAREGCHLFLEKPVSHALEGVDDLIEIVERKNLVAFVAYQFRFHPGLQLIKARLEAGDLGYLAAAHIVNGEYLPAWHPYEDYRQSHASRRAMGGGCLAIQTHELDYAVWFFGLPSTVYAAGGHLSRLEIDVEDSVSLLMKCKFKDRPFPVHIHLDYLQRPPQRTCEIYGDAGKVRYDYYTNAVEFSETATGQTELSRFEGFDRNQMFMDELKHFVACVRGEDKPLVDLREGRRSMLISDAAARSLRNGTAVTIDNV
jgi:predicted dehydrogenase